MSDFQEQLKKCLQDTPAECEAACPFSLDIRSFVSKIKRGAFGPAYRAYADAVVFPNIVNKLCNEPCRIQCRLTGLDCDPKRASEDVRFGDAAAMSFADETFDGVMIECSLSQMQDAGKVLSECHRVLKAGGKLILTDLYARKGGRSENTMLGRLDSEETIRQRLGAQKFSVQLFEDASQLLTEFWASALMSGRGDQLYQKMRIDEGLKSCQCGYYLCIAERKAKGGVDS